MTLADAPAAPPAVPAAPGAAPLRRGEELVLARGGRFKLLVPLAGVERVEQAALPALRPGAGAPAHPVVAVRGALLPVLFAEALLGAEEATLRPGDQLLVLRDEERRALLWVSALEEVLPFEPLPPPAGARDELVAGFSGAPEPLAVLDVRRALDLAAGPLEDA
ncbi:MAG TPA: chemotaxis protein CheW [Anaeromyxobacteraceae bacterium]|nr:chemotaxis protein CheW [Anaeromyxobacteraceae bacterium]